METNYNEISGQMKSIPLLKFQFSRIIELFLDLNYFELQLKYYMHKILTYKVKKETLQTLILKHKILQIL